MVRDIQVLKFRERGLARLEYKARFVRQQETEGKDSAMYQIYQNSLVVLLKMEIKMSGMLMN